MTTDLRGNGMRYSHSKEVKGRYYKKIIDLFHSKYYIVEYIIKRSLSEYNKAILRHENASEVNQKTFRTRDKKVSNRCDGLFSHRYAEIATAIHESGYIFVCHLQNRTKICMSSFRNRCSVAGRLE